MRRRVTLTLLVLGLLGLLGGLLSWQTLRYGFSTHDEPTRMEAMNPVSPMELRERNEEKDFLEGDHPE